MNKQAMILDDEAGVRKLVDHIVSAHGYITRTFESPADVDEHIAASTGGHRQNRFTPDIIISDMHMPHLTGLDYIRNLRRSGQSARHVALMSGNWNQTDLEEANSLGCKIFFKPFLSNELHSWLGSLPP